MLLTKSQYSNFEIVDYSQLLQEEVTHRHLVEAELEAMKASANQGIAVAEIAALRHEKETDMVKLLEQENETSNLKEINARLIAELNISRAIQSSFLLKEDTSNSDCKRRLFNGDIAITDSTGNVISKSRLHEPLSAIQLRFAENTDKCGCVEVKSRVSI